MELSKEELNNISGGVTGTILNSIIRGVNTIFEIGRSLGSSIRRIFTRRYC